MRRHRQHYPTQDGVFLTSDDAPAQPSATTSSGYYGNYANNGGPVHRACSDLSSEFSAIAQRAVGHVACGLAFILCMSQCGIFDVVRTDTDLNHYAERHTGGWLPAWIPMPLNTAVNVGYTVCGVCWMLRTRNRFLTGSLPNHSAYLFCVFACMAAAYGPVQLFRILRMSHSLAVIDQWVTLPFFAWVPIWVWATSVGRLSATGTLAVMVASLLSYLLAVVTDLGFELSLTLHVAAAVGSGVFLCLYPALAAPGVINAVSMSALSCCGFVVLKLLDHELAAVSGGFRIVSGHFMSKVADVMQIHFVCRAFECIAEARGANRKMA